MRFNKCLHLQERGDISILARGVEGAKIGFGCGGKRGAFRKNDEIGSPHLETSNMFHQQRDFANAYNHRQQVG